MKYEKKFSQQEQRQVSESQTESQTQASQTIHEFAQPEDVLRFDAKQTAVPDSVAERLSQSLQRHPLPPARPWWAFWKRS